jgi:hypothetical protein
MRMRQFLLHPVIDRRELRGSRHHECMGRCAQSAVGTVDLPPGSTTADQAKIADALGGAKALEDKRYAWVKTLRGAFVRGCLKSPEMSVFDRCRATSEGVSIALSPLKSMMPISHGHRFMQPQRLFKQPLREPTHPRPPVPREKRAYPTLLGMHGL